MSHSGHSSSSSPSNSGSHENMMAMAFHTSTTDTLFADSWTPSTAGQYAGTIIFLIVLAIFYRCLAAVKSVQEVKWAKRDERRVIIIAGQSQEQADIKKGIESRDGSKDGMLDGPVSAYRGAQEKKRPEEGGVDNGNGNGNVGSPWSKPWRWSTDLPRAGLSTIVSGTGYLLMLAVMTFNVGYFMAVLAGLFVGELAFGRFIKGMEH